MARRIKQRVFSGSLAHNFSTTGATLPYNAAGKIAAQSFTSSMWVMAGPESIAVSGTHNLLGCAPSTFLVSQFGAQLLVYIAGTIRHTDPTFFTTRANRWVHLTIVCNNTANTISTYADGELTLTTAAVPAWNLTNNHNYEIGAGTFNGMIASSFESTVRHWNGVAMTAGQVAALYYDDIDPVPANKIVEALFAEQTGTTMANTGTMGGSFSFVASGWSFNVPFCKVRRATVNLLPNSEAPTNANWPLNTGLASVVVDAGVPHPTRASGVVQRATENVALSGHVARAYPLGSAAEMDANPQIVNTALRFTVKVKKGVGRDWLLIGVSTTIASCSFNMATGQISTAVLPNNANAAVSVLGNGWYEVTMFASPIANVNRTCCMWMSNADGSVSYTGDGSYFYFCDPTCQAVESPPDYTRGLNYNGVQSTLLTSQNLARYSQDFSNAAWTKTFLSAPVLVSAGGGPGGLPTWRLTDTAVLGVHVTLQSITADTVQSKQLRTISAIVKNETRRWIAITYDAGNQGSYFDLQNGVLGTTFMQAGSGGFASITPLGDGFYLCSITCNSAITPNTTASVYLASADNGATYTGDGSSILLSAVWVTNTNGRAEYVATTSGAINTGTPRYQTPRQNLIRFSNDMTQVAAFALTNLTSIVALGNVGPGGMPAFRMTDNVGAGGHYTSQTISPVPTIGRAYTLSANVRAGTKTAVVLAPEGAGFQVTYDLTAVTATTGVGAPLGTSITPLGDGWYRCALTFVSAGASGYRFYISPTAYVADGTGTMDWCGLQLTEASGVANYVATGTATTSEGAPRGLVGQQNLIIRTGALDNAVTWIPSLTTIAAGATDPQGGSTAFTLRETNGGTTIYSFLQTPPAALVRNVAFTFSIYVKRGTGTRNLCLGANSGQIAAFYDLATGAIPSGGLYDPQGNVIGRAMEAVGDGWYRCSVTYYQNSSTSVIVYVAQGTTTTITGDTANTLILWHPQMTQSTGLSPYVETTTTAINAGAPRGQSL